MSNYPPGVTGNEYQIAGPDSEGDCQRDCRRCAFIAAENGWFDNTSMEWFVRDEDGEPVNADECDWSEAPVRLTLHDYSTYQGYWNATCGVCGLESEGDQDEW